MAYEKHIPTPRLSKNEKAILDEVLSNLGKVDADKAAILDKIDFAVVDELHDDQAAAQFELQRDGRALVSVKRSGLADGASWNLHNSIAHEIRHFEQSQDPLLADYFQLTPDAKNSAKFGFLIEADAYLNTQLLMDELSTQGIVVREPDNQKGSAAEIDTMYQQIKHLGYSAETGEAQRTMFRTLVLGTDGQFAAQYIFSRLKDEVKTLAKLNTVIKNRNIAEGQMNVENILITDKAPPDVANTMLGKFGKINFMTDDEGKMAFINDPDFLNTVFNPEQMDFFKSLVDEHAQEMNMAKPYIAAKHEKDDTPPANTGKGTAEAAFEPQITRNG